MSIELNFEVKKIDSETFCVGCKLIVQSLNCDSKVLIHEKKRPQPLLGVSVLQMVCNQDSWSSEQMLGILEGLNLVVLNKKESIVEEKGET